MTTDQPVFIDATMLLRWQHLAPVGIVRLERMLAAHLRFHSSLPSAHYVVWDAGYRLATDVEARALDALLSESETRRATVVDRAPPTEIAITSTRLLPRVRRVGLKAIGRLPGHLRPFAEQAAWSAATLGVESARYARRSWDERGARRIAAARRTTGPAVHHRVDFTRGGDLIAVGLGWEYLDHEAMYLLRCDFGLRIHMPAFDLIAVQMPQMNAGQSHLVHRYYAEMAHYADTITSISDATADALEQFFADEDLPCPLIVTNQLPGLPPPRTAPDTGAYPRHRLVGQQFVLSVSTIEIRKNHLLLAKLWTEYIKDGLDVPTLVLVGRVGWDAGELLRWVEYAPELDDRVLILQDVEDDELVELYRDCLFTVFPSRIEGWGLPITESLSHGKVCIHATDPAQLEASQGLMPALHPDDFVVWKSEILRMVFDEAHRAELERVINERYVERTPRMYCEAFEKILAERRVEVPA